MGIDPISWVVIAVVAIVGAVSYSSMEKAKKAARRAADRMAGINYQTRTAIAPRRLIYGTARVGGEECYFSTTGDENEFFHLMLYWCEGPCQSISVQADGETLSLDGTGLVTSGQYAGLIRIKNHLGAVDQTADASAVAELSDWTSAHKGAGICYSYLRLEYDREVFASGMPSFSAVIQGRNDIYDPRDESTGHSNNLALCWAHYFSLARSGPGVDYSAINEDQLIDAANVCDEAVALAAGGTEPRYVFDGLLLLDEDVETNLQLFNSSMGGNTVYVGGEWFIYPGAYRAPTFEITEDMLVGPVRMKTKIPRRDLANTVKGTYVSSADNYQMTSFPPVQNATWLAEDGQELALEINLTATKSNAAVQRLAKLELYTSRMARTAMLTLDARGLRAVPGGTVSLTLPLYGFDDTPMLVEEWSLGIQNGALTVNVSLRETAEANFAWDAEEVARAAVTAPAVYSSSDMDAPTGVTATPLSTYSINSSGDAKTSILLEWDDPLNVFVRDGYVRIKWREDGEALPKGSVWLGGDVSSYEVTDLDPSTTYEFHIWFVESIFGQYSDRTIVEAETGTWDGTIYLPPVAMPVADPVAGAYPAIDFPLSVSLSSATAGAEIRYSKTAMPTSVTEGTEYTSTLTISDGETIYAKAFKSGMQASTGLVATYTAV